MSPPVFPSCFLAMVSPGGHFLYVLSGGAGARGCGGAGARGRGGAGSGGAEQESDGCVRVEEVSEARHTSRAPDVDGVLQGVRLGVQVGEGSACISGVKLRERKEEHTGQYTQSCG